VRFGAVLARVSNQLMARRVEVEALILAFLTVLRAGVTIMMLNGKSR
jgi:hypothetical protein